MPDTPRGSAARLRWQRLTAVVCWLDVFVAFIGVAAGGWTIIGWIALVLFGGANAAVASIATNEVVHAD